MDHLIQAGQPYVASSRVDQFYAALWTNFAPPLTRAAGEAMAQSVEERLEPILLEPVRDLLEPIQIETNA